MQSSNSNGKRSLVHSTSVERIENENIPVRRRLTDGIKRPRSKSRKRRTQEFLNRTSTDIQPPDIKEFSLSTENSPRGSSEIKQETTEEGYRSDTSDNGDDLHETFQDVDLAQQQTTPTKTTKEGGERPVSRLKRTLSGKLRSASSNKVNENPQPVDSLHKSLSQGISGKAFSKIIKKASNIDQTDSKGQSFLHVCASRGLLDCIRVLLKKGCNVNLQDNMGYTPLHCAAIERRLDSCLLLLETKSIDVSILNNEKSNVLHYLVRIQVDDSNSILFRSVLDLLISKGININMGNKHNEAPIHFACMKRNIHTVAFLLERGADCNFRTSFRETPLHYAVRAGSIKLVRMLMESAADPTAEADDDRFTPVDVAEQYQFSDILDCLQCK